MRIKSGNAAGSLACLLLAAMLGAAMLACVLCGAVSYRAVEEAASSRMDSLSGIGYVSTKIRSADAAGCVSAGMFGDGDALFLRTDYDGTWYITAIYAYGGRLRELFYEEGWDSDPAAGEIVGDAAAFRVEDLGGGLFRVSVESPDGTARSALAYGRSAGNG